MNTNSVSVSWLHEHHDDADVVIVDTRSPAYYLQGHIRRSVNLPVFLLAGPDGPPEPVTFARRLGVLGIQRDSHIVAYDDGASPMAARLFWVMSWYGHASLSVLDGGLTAWAHAGEEYENHGVTPAPVQYEIGQTDTTVRALWEDVRAAIGSSDSVIVDTRTPLEYLGTQVSAARDGHIPGAINIDSRANFERGSDGLIRLLPKPELRHFYEGAGVTPDKRVIVYCQSGARSSQTFTALKSLGYSRVANYDAGWQEWGNLPDTPVEMR